MPTYGTLNADIIGNSNGMTGNGIGPGFKNRIINGDMRIDQRNAGAAVTVNNVGIYSVDRWANVARSTGGGVYSAQQVSDAPTGFNNSLKLTVTTVDTSLGTSDYYFVWQNIEGFNTADLMFGTANAKTVTLSFWVKSSITGQFSAFLINSAENYSQPYAYTINAANTWEYKTITFTGATAGTWIGATNGVGLRVGFALANGTDLQGTSGSWSANDHYGSTGDVNWMATNGNTFQITGVQLEVGETATSFDYRPYGTELALCQRYYQTAGAAAVGNVDGSGVTYIAITEKLFTPMRTAPSGSIYSGVTASFRSQGGDISAASPGLANFAANGTTSFWTQVTGFGALTNFAVVYGRNNISTNGGNFIALSSEL